MKVLITGGYGFIGAHTAGKFYSEGHEVFIIDNFAKGKPESIDFKHKFYKTNVEDSKCANIFNSCRFDVVVHLAAHNNEGCSVENLEEDTKTNILGLINMLELSAKYRVKKFIYASSSEVYKREQKMPLKESDICEPVSQTGMNKYLGEKYCENWKKYHGLNTVCFRFSNVYGPYKTSGVVSKFIKSSLNGEALAVFGEGEQKIDFIYVKDVTEAVCRAAEDDSQGVYNLSSNTQISVNQVIESMENIFGSVNVYSREVVGIACDELCLDNTKVKKQLDWVPVWTFDEGVKETVDWCKSGKKNRYGKNFESKLEKNEDNTGENDKKSKYLKLFKKFKPYLENLALFILVMICEWLLKDDSVVMKTFDIKIVYLVIIGIAYGTRQSVFAIVLASLGFLFNSLNIGKGLLSMMIDNSFILQISLYALIGKTIGYITDKKNIAAEKAEKRYLALDDKYVLLRELYDETYEVKCELHKQIVSSEDSFGKIYNTIKKLDSINIQSVLKSAVEVMEEILKNKSVLIYTVDSSEKYLRLSAKSANEYDNLPKSIQIDYLGEASETLLNNKIYINRNMEPDLPVIMSPIECNGKLIAVVALNKIEFETLTLHYQNRFKIVSELISSSVARAYEFEVETRNKRYVEGTNILKREEFDNILNIHKKASEKNICCFSLIHIPKGEKFSKLCKVLDKSVRETDFIGLDHKENMLVLLANSTDKDSGLVINRLKNDGIRAEVLKNESIA